MSTKNKSLDQARGKWKTEWDLKTLYKSLKDLQIEKDVSEAERKIKSFAKKYTKDQSYLEDSKSLLKLLKEDNKIDELAGVNKPLRYLHLLRESGVLDQEIDKKMVLISERLKKVSILTQPIFLKLGKIDKKTQKKFLVSKDLEEFHYFLKLFFERAKYQLSESEEKVLLLKSGPSSSMWNKGFDKASSKKTVKLDGKEISLGEATFKLKDLPKVKRDKLYSEIMEQAISLADYAEGELNSTILDKKINDELRGKKNPYDSRFLADEVDEKNILDFAKLVTDNFKIAHKFYRIKKKLLNLEEREMNYVDRLATIGKIKEKFTFEKSSKILLEVFEEVNPKYSKLLNEFLINGQIDVYPRKNKSSGAFQWAGTNVPTVVLLNHVDNLDSLTTYAHEMGHTIHSTLSKENQPIHYQGYSTAVAETASTFFENFVFDKALENLSEKEKIIALHDQIDSKIATVFRQIAAFNFELDLHNKIRKEGFAEHQEIAKLMQKHLKSYLGDAIRLEEKDGYAYVLWSHFRNFFYVYTYAYGELISDSLYEKYKENPKFIKKIEEILKAGDSMPPKKIFKKAGIDISDMKFFKKGLEKIEKDIEKLEKLAISL
jgi:oligoendopeptidase F